MERQDEKQQQEIKSIPREYRNLISPCKIPAEDTSHLAVDDLKFALQQRDSRNIAVTGHYGSGKSSVVNTSISELGKDNKVLRISMSTFSLQSEKEPENENLYMGDVEYKIVQHLLYKCDKNKIPRSGFKRIQEPQSRDFGSHVLLIILALACYVVAFEPAFLRIDSFYDAYYGLFGEKVGWWINLISDVLSAGYLFWFLYRVGLIIAANLNQIRSVKIEAKDIKLEATKESGVSVFNKYLDEIIYIIQQNDYDYILFEDLDRLDNSDKLFLKIRELNMLINESEAFKQRNRIVKFIYAIRDDVFSRELRTKCFDYIVAVVPVVDQYNVKDYVIKEYKCKGLFKTIETSVLEQLLNKVAGLRELKNIVNEYTLFEKSLRTHLSEDVESYEQRLLAVIIYKNLYPQDFAKTYEDKGLFFTVFQNKKLFYEGLTKELREKLQAAEQGMSDAREKIVSARKQYLDKMNDGIIVTSLVKDGYDYTLDQVANRDNLFELFENDDFDRYTYIEDDYETTRESDYNLKFSDLENMVTEDMGYYEAVYDDQEKYSSCNNERIKLEKEIKVIENTSLQELIKKNGPEKTKEILTSLYLQEYKKKAGEIEVNGEMIDTLQTMLYGGYLTEDYYLYISKFYEGSISESDYQFYNALLQGIERPYGQKLNSAKSVVSKLRVENFKDKSVLNYDILNYILENKEEHYIAIFVETVRRTPEFIVSYSQISDTVRDEFFDRVFDKWDSCVNIMREQEKAENREALLELFFRVSPISIKLKDEEKDYLEGRYEFIHTHIQKMNIGKLKKFCNHFYLSFEALVKPNQQSQEFYSNCLVNRRFVINKNNLEVILGEDFDKKPMTAILAITESRLQKYLLKNLKQVVKMFDGACDEEERESLVYMIKETVAEDEWLYQYIAKQRGNFDTITDLDERAVGLILRADKLDATWALILDAVSIIGSLSDELNNFITRHVISLSASKCAGAKELVDILHQELFSGEKQPINEFKALLNSFEQNFTIDEIKTLSDDRIAEIIKQKRVGASSMIFDYLNQNCSNKIADDYLLFHFDAILDDEELNWSDYVRNSMGIHILNSHLTIVQKKHFLDGVLILQKGKIDTWELAKLVCEYYNRSGVDGADKDLVVSALMEYQGNDSWATKINLINKCNATWTYSTELENKLLDGLGGEYHKLTYARGWASFDNNEHNEALLNFLKEKGHYISRVEERVGQYYVTFRHS